MNRDQKAAAVAEIAASIKESEAVYAVDFRGISVTQAAELRSQLRDAGASLRIVKNSLTERAADDAQAVSLKELLQGPTALTFVRADGDVALAAKALATFNRQTETMAFKGGLLSGNAVSIEELASLARLPGREVLYGQLVGVVASPITGLVRGLNALIGGLALQLGQIAELKQSGEIPAGDPPAQAAAEVTDSDATAEPADAPEAPAEAGAEPEAPAEANDTSDTDTDDNEADASA